MTAEAQDLRRRAEELRDEPAEAWIPEPGDVLVGELVDIDVRAAEHDPAVPVLTMRTDSDELVAVWAFYTVLRSELQKVSPQPGEWLGIRRLEDSEKGYRRYGVIPYRDKPREFLVGPHLHRWWRRGTGGPHEASYAGEGDTEGCGHGRAPSHRTQRRPSVVVRRVGPDHPSWGWSEPGGRDRHA